METVKGPDSKEERMERMVALYQLPLLRLCILYLHDEELAKDAVQETFIKAYRNLDGFRSEASEKTWLTRIAVNTCKSVYRSGWFRHVDRSVTGYEERARACHLEHCPVNKAVVRTNQKERTGFWHVLDAVDFDLVAEHERECEAKPSAE